MDNNDNEKHIELICQIRGSVIQACIELETLMDSYIAEHFCETDSKIFEMASIVLAPRVTWREKLSIFCTILEAHIPAFKDGVKGFNTDILMIIEHRNVFAHFPADTSNTAIELFKIDGTILFFKFKNGRNDKKELVYLKQPKYTKEMINNIISGANLYTQEIAKMIKSR